MLNVMSYTWHMKCTAQVKLLTTKAQAASLKETLRLANEACNYISGRAFSAGVFGQFKLHALVYYDTRNRFIRLGSCIIVRCIKKVADAYQLDKKTQRTFKPTGSIDLDHNLIRWYQKKKTVSIWTAHGREKIRYICGVRQDTLLQTQQGQPDLATFKGKYFLLAPCNVEDPDPDIVDDVLGVDFGIVNLAVTSDGNTFKGHAVERVRERISKIRAALQKKGTKSAKRHLIKISRRESRFKKDTNHCISKGIVSIAKGTERSIALEDLAQLSARTTVRRSQRDRHGKWAYAQLRGFIEYKAKAAGVAVVAVDPAYTSQRCPACGCVSRKNRPTRDRFLCIQCQYSNSADYVGALNIRTKGRTSIRLSQSETLRKKSGLLELQAVCLS